jgi:hypothetical protein
VCVSLAVHYTLRHAFQLSASHSLPSDVPEPTEMGSSGHACDATARASVLGGTGEPRVYALCHRRIMPSQPLIACLRLRLAEESSTHCALEEPDHLSDMPAIAFQGAEDIDIAASQAHALNKRARRH